MKRNIKKGMALLLAVLMLVPAGAFAWAAEPKSTEPADTLGQILVQLNRDDLTEQEQLLLESDILAQPDLTPAAEELKGNITIDYADEEVVVLPYTAADGSVWLPGEVSVDGVVCEAAPAADGSKTVAVTLPIDCVEVQYKLTVGTDVQNAYLQALKNIADMLNRAAAAVPAAEVLQHLLGQGVHIDLSDYTANLLAFIYESFSDLPVSSVHSILDAYAETGLWGGAQVPAYDGSKGFFATITSSYYGVVTPAEAAGVLKALLADYTEDELGAFDRLSSCFAAEGVTGAAALCDPAFGAELQSLYKQAVVFYDAASTVNNSAFNGINPQIAAAMTEAGSDARTALEKLWAEPTANFDNICIKLIGALAPANSFDYSTLPALKKSMAEEESASFDAIVNAAMKDAAALGKAEADEPLVFTTDVVTNAKKCTVTADWDTFAPVPYGTVIELPKHGAEGMVWIYTVNGDSCDQGTALRITEDTVITREAWEAHSWGSLLSTLTTGTGAAILCQPALKTGNTKLHTPGAEDNLLSVSWDAEKGYEVAAAAFAANAEKIWLPVKAEAIKDSVVKSTDSFTDEKASLPTGDYDTIRVTYSVTLPYNGIDAAAILALPAVLAADAVDQMDIIADLNRDGMLKNLEKVQNLIWNVRNVIFAFDEDNQPAGDPDSMAAITEIITKCCDKLEGNNYTFHLYKWMLDYSELTSDAERLAFYYRNYESILAEIAILDKDLPFIAHDSHVDDILELFNEQERASEIDDLIKDFDDIFVSLQDVPPSPYIDCTAEAAELTALAAQVLSHQAGEAAEAGDAITLTAVLDTAAPKANVVVTVSGGDDSVAELIGGGSYAVGEEVTIAAPETVASEQDTEVAYEFLGWYSGEECIDSSAEHTFIATGDENLIAKYRPVQSSFEITVNGSSEIAGVSGTTTTKEKGASVTVSYTGTDPFLYWVNESGKIISTEKTYTFTVSRSRTLTPVCGVGATLIFQSAYKQVLSSVPYTVGNEITFPAIPGKMGCTFVGWCANGSGEPIQNGDVAGAIESLLTAAPGSTITLVANYAQTEDTYTVTLNFEGVSHEAVIYTPKVGDVQKFTAPEIDGYLFSCWKDVNGAVVSTSSAYMVRSTEEVTLTAVYVEEGGTPETARPLVVMTGSYAAVNGEKYRVSFTASRSVPEDYTIVEAGFLYGTDAEFAGLNAQRLMTLNHEGVKKALANAAKQDDIFTLNINTANADKVFHVRAFVTLQKGSELSTIYSDEITSHSYNTLNP